MEPIAKLTELLLAARCPDPSCDGFGTVEGVAETTEPGCCGSPLPNGECCGDAVAVQGQEQSLEPCQWCHERAGILERPDLLEGKPNIKTGKPMLIIDAARLSDPDYRDELGELGLLVTTSDDEDFDNALPI